jgi:hypothetical protein
MGHQGSRIVTVDDGAGTSPSEKPNMSGGGRGGGGRGYVRVQTASSDECPREERGAGRGGPASRQPPYLQNSRGDTTWAVLAPHRSENRAEKARAHHHNTTAYDIFGKRVGLGDCAFNLPWFLFCFREKWIYDEYSAFTPLDIPRSEGWWWLTLLSTTIHTYPRTTCWREDVILNTHERKLSTKYLLTQYLLRDLSMDRRPLTHII